MTIDYFLNNEEKEDEDKTEGMLCRKVTSKLYHLKGEKFMAKFPKSHTEMVFVPAGWLVIFRQDLIHQGCGYQEANLRYFMYMDLIGVKRAKNSTTKVDLKNRNLLNLKTNELTRKFEYLLKVFNTKE